MRKNKSAIKKAKQSEEKRLRNSHVRTTMKTQIKKVMAAMQTDDKSHVNELFKSAVASINKTASKNVIHKNNAARKISRLSKKVSKVLNAK